MQTLQHKQHLKDFMSLFSLISTPGAALAVTYHVMMIETASLLRGSRFPKIRCKHHKGFFFSCNAVFLFCEEILLHCISYRRIVDENSFIYNKTD